MTADAACTCTMTDPRTWTRYGSAVEPGSMLEPNPDCPEHFPKADDAGVSEREQMARIAMGLNPTEGWGQSAEWERVAFYEIADALLAAGFGDVAEAWDEGATWAWGNSGEGWNGEYPGEPVDLSANPHRTPGANGGGA